MKATSQELQTMHVVIKNEALVYESYGSSKSVVPTRCDFFPPKGLPCDLSFPSLVPDGATGGVCCPLYSNQLWSSGSAYLLQMQCCSSEWILKTEQ